MNELQSSEQIEAWLVDACRQLGVPVTSGADDLFDAGANSLTVVRLIARIDAEFGPDTLAPDDLFRCADLREIADLLWRARTRVDSLTDG
ncbi:MAG TPA: acyl carrier protein [Pseudonocardiaceae bacterium]|nr:acyl carrier protein [Pseudonocardiaceae bacterium]